MEGADKSKIKIMKHYFCFLLGADTKIWDSFFQGQLLMCKFAKLIFQTLKM